MDGRTHFPPPQRHPSPPPATEKDALAQTCPSPGRPDLCRVPHSHHPGVPTASLEAHPCEWPSHVTPKHARSQAPAGGCDGALTSAGTCEVFLERTHAGGKGNRLTHRERPPLLHLLPFRTCLSGGIYGADSQVSANYEVGE